MSRQWERMVKRNRKIVNQKRLKDGKKAITTATSTDEVMETIYGRSWFLPALFVAVSAFFATVSIAFYEADLMLWGTIAAYLVLGFIYYLRKPYLKVGKKQLATKKLGVERYLNADDIESIEVQQGSIMIQLKAKNKRWIFTKFQNLYNIPLMALRLKTFANHNQIRFEEVGVTVDKAG